MTPRRRAVLRLCALAPLVAAPALSRGQTAWAPSRPIRLVVPFAAGGSADNSARAIGARMAETLGQPVVVENRGGGAGAIAANAVLDPASPRDGHTLLWGGQAIFVTNPHLYERLSYRPEDFLPVSVGARLPMVLAVHPAFPARTLAEFRDRVRADGPGRHSYATVGRGGMTHVFGELIEAEMGLDMQDVPYRGSAPALQDLLAGNIRVSVDGLIPALAHHRAGTLRILAVSSERGVEGVPSFAEQGWPQLTASLWFGLFAPVGTPEAAVRRLSDSVREAASREDIRARMAADGVEPAGSAPEAFAAEVARERERWGAVIRRANIRLSE